MKFLFLPVNSDIFLEIYVYFLGDLLIVEAIAMKVVFSLFLYQCFTSLYFFVGLKTIYKSQILFR